MIEDWEARLIVSHKVLSPACGFAIALCSCASTMSVDDARTAIAIARQVCVHAGGLWPKGGLKPADWNARLDGDTWKVWTGAEGKGLVVLIPKHGAIPTDCHSPFAD